MQLGRPMARGAPRRRMHPQLRDIVRTFRVTRAGKFYFPQVTVRSGRLSEAVTAPLTSATLPDLVATMGRLTPALWCDDRDVTVETAIPSALELSDIGRRRVDGVGADGLMVILPEQRRTWGELRAVPAMRSDGRSAPAHQRAMVLGLQAAQPHSWPVARLLLLADPQRVEPAITGAQWLITASADVFSALLARHYGGPPLAGHDLALEAAALFLHAGAVCDVRRTVTFETSRMVTVTRRVPYSRIAQGAYRVDEGGDGCLPVRDLEEERVPHREQRRQAVTFGPDRRWTVTTTDAPAIRSSDRIESTLVQATDWTVAAFCHGGTRLLSMTHVFPVDPEHLNFPPPAWLGGL
ncbi:MAG: hypothetical protein HY696_01155 [Deltaproteobacteria bacterium]|nr:hypothetical protein [Deltaproteobacteria bacterium]